ncbi:unnamed protein product [Boreogadus saida]
MRREMRGEKDNTEKRFGVMLCRCPCRSQAECRENKGSMDHATLPEPGRVQGEPRLHGPRHTAMCHVHVAFVCLKSALPFFKHKTKPPQLFQRPRLIKRVYASIPIAVCV